MANYQDEFTALKYLDFLNSTNGQMQQKFLLDAILPRLPKDRNSRILDAGCGSGWLAGELKKYYNDVSGCDASEFFIKFAKANYPAIDFTIADVNQLLPYPQSRFDVVILNMVGPDLDKLDVAFKNVTAAMKPGGNLLMTIPNPKYTYPGAEWKRNLIDVALGRKPRLKIKKSPPSGTKIQREFGRDVKIESYYYNQQDYISSAQAAGLTLRDVLEIKSQSDSPNFDLTYQLHRYPLILLLVFEKTSQ